MALKKLAFKPGINREVTRYTNEAGWYECDKVRFRQGFPEKIGGWERISVSVFQGVCRSLSNWVTLGSINLIGVGTHLKFYLEQGGGYNDITPIRETTAAGDVTFAATNGSATLTITDAGHGARGGDFVTFTGAVSLGGNITAVVLNAEYQIVTVPDANTYTITATATANASDTGNGGSSVVGAYQIRTGEPYEVPLTGWSGGTWGAGVWGTGDTSTESIRLWSQSNFGEDLIFGPRGGDLFYWDATNGVETRAVYLNTLAGASNVPTKQNFILVSDVSRFVFCFGTNISGSATFDPMLIRWSDQEDPTNWTPAVTNQAGDLRLSKGTEIVTAKQSRQEVLVWTDSSVYSLQYQGAPIVWGVQLVGDNISIASQNAVGFSGGVAYWMGKDKFYSYDGRTQTLPCDVRRFIFNDFNELQYDQVFAGTNEAFHEIWWFYCSQNSQTIDRYVVYNYLEKTWYYGTMARTAWLDSGLRDYPLAASYTYNLTNQEFGTDDNETGTPVPISASITSGQFDIADGDRFAFIWRLMPDMTFDGSTTTDPHATMSLLPLANSGSGYNSPTSEGGSNSGTVTRTATVPIEKFTGQVNTRVRGRQMSIKVESDSLGVRWQLGSPRVDMRPDGRR
tara:strand:- start:974 stop:2842 length:1869 start_codon:yes stop_codon:yes gene_type:complete